MINLINKILNKPTRNLGIQVAFILYFTGIIAIFFPFNVLNGLQVGSYKINIDKYSDLGSFISGVSGFFLTSATFILLILTYSTQRKELQETKSLLQKQNFESKYFELLKAHRENLHEIEKDRITGRMVFVLLKDEFKIIFDDIIKLKDQLQLDISHSDIIDLAFRVLYFGSGPLSTRIIERIQVSHPIANAIPIIQHFEDKNINDGHQIRLTHYLNHIFETINFIEDQSNLSVADKASYLSLLKSQLSAHELAIIGLNSLSFSGKKWKNKDYIQKYDLLSMMPPGTMHYIDWHNLFPAIKFVS